MAVVGEVKRVDGYGSGNELDGYNKIQAKNDARIKRNTRGFETGILDMSFQGDTETRVPNAAESFQLTATTNQNITLGKGIATCYGFDLVVDGLILFDTIAPPAVNEKYIFIYLEWNLANPDSNEFNVGTWDNGTGTTWTPAEQDNLANVPNGKYRLPLYRLTISSNGNITGTQNYATLGVQTYNGTQNTNYAQTALKYDNKDDTVDGSIAKKFREVLDYQAETDIKWYEQKHTYLSLSIWNSTDTKGMFKNGDKVVIDYSSVVSNKGSTPTTNTVLGTISLNSFRPKKEIVCFVYLRRTDDNSYSRCYSCTIGIDGKITIVGIVYTVGSPNLTITYSYYVYASIVYDVSEE